MKRILRIIIALIFIASGFVKAIDVVGFSFKLEEYFSPSVFNMPFFEALALPIAILVVALELILGFMLLLNLHIKKVLGAMIALCIFFAFLTFYSAFFNKVTDCGCFGDAVKFTPWQSFIKDIVLLLGLIVLWLAYRKNFNENENKSSFRKTVLVISMVATAFIIGWGIIYEPLIDFRDYKIGTDLNAERTKIQANPSEYKTFYLMKHKTTGEEKEVNQDDYVNDKQYWEENSPWEIQSDKTLSKIVKEGYKSEITKFKLEDANGNDITENILTAPKVIVMFSYHPKEADQNIISQAEAKMKATKDATVLGVSTVEGTFKMIDNATMDGTAIKTIARSNPFILTLQNGKITDKMSAKDYIKN